jgi:hypothetical protein
LPEFEIKILYLHIFLWPRYCPKSPGAFTVKE